MAADDYTPMYVGDLAPVLSVTVTTKAGTPIDLTGATVTVLFASRSASFTGTGVVAIATPATNGQFTYAWASADTAAAFSGTIQFAIVLGSGKLIHTDPKPLVILAVTD